jgi:transposase
MEQLTERCAGLDVHQAEITACARIPGEKGGVAEIVQAFGTTTPDLLAMLDWLVALGVTEVAMESTGVFWKSPYYVLEGQFDRVLVVNAAHIKHVPGRKTDVIDAAWIAQLLAHGLLRGSFVPPPSIRELRDLTRYRKALTEERNREVNRIHKILEDAGVKLAVVASDVMGVSGRAMMRALIEGQADPEALRPIWPREGSGEAAGAAHGPHLPFRGHHAFLLGRMLAHVVDLESDLEAVQERIEEAVAPFARQVEVLDSIPGVGRVAAQAILAEIGTDMSVFPTAEHCASWAGMCPGQNESAGKRKSGKTRKGSRWLRTILLECAHAAGRSRGTYLSERYRQLARRRGKKKALVAIGHDILVTAYHLLATDQFYEDAGPERVKTEAEELAKRRAIRQLQSLGYRVALTTLPGAAA